MAINTLSLGTPHVSTKSDDLSQPFDKNAFRNSVIKDVAFKSLFELAAGFTMIGVTAMFVATTALPTLFALNGSILAFSVLTRCISGFITYKTQINLSEGKIDEEDAKNNNMFVKTTKYFCSALFASVSSMTGHVTVHESGHALAVKALFANTTPKISINPLDGSTTTFIADSLTNLGSKLGMKWSLVTVAAAGSALGVFTSTVSYAIGRAISKQAPELGRYMEAYGISGIALHAIYAISALFSAQMGGDFTMIARLSGINPLVSLVGLIALPAIVISGMELYYHFSR